MNEVEFIGERIRLAQDFDTYEALAAHKEKVHPTEVSRVYRLVTEFEAPKHWSDFANCVRSLSALVFPGCSSGVFGVASSLSGDLRLLHFSIPCSPKKRVFALHVTSAGCDITDDFLLDASILSQIRLVKFDLRGGCMYTDQEGNVIRHTKHK